MDEPKVIELSPYVWARIVQIMGDWAINEPQEVVTFLLGIGCGTFLMNEEAQRQMKQDTA